MELENGLHGRRVLVISSCNQVVVGITFTVTVATVISHQEALVLRFSFSREIPFSRCEFRFRFQRKWPCLCPCVLRMCDWSLKWLTPEECTWPRQRSNLDENKPAAPAFLGEMLVVWHRLRVGGEDWCRGGTKRQMAATEVGSEASCTPRNICAVETTFCAPLSPCRILV